MPFKSYVEIENTYREKILAFWLEKFPELRKEQFVIEEKIDGSNVQLIFEKDVPVKVRSRGSLLPNLGDGFYGLNVVLSSEEYQEIIKILQSLIDVIGNFAIYGEFFGMGIQKGIDYGEGKRLLFFDIFSEKIDSLIPSKEFFEIMNSKNLEKYTVPLLAVVSSLQEALDYNEIFDSKILGKENNQAEGIVIKPWNKQFVMHDDLFYLKKKNEKFAEKVKVPKEKVTPEMDERIFGYITDQRVSSVESKVGPIHDKSKVGYYINLVSEDATKDFFKDYPDANATLVANAVKKIKPEIAKLLLKRIL